MSASGRQPRRAYADSVVNALPHGYDQMLGRRFEGGVDLSGGEWQKIALARAYMRDAQVLILDEPTATLDARAEYEVFLALRGPDPRQDGRADLPPVLDRAHGGPDPCTREWPYSRRGISRATRSHAGRYAELFELQAAGYR